MRSVVRVFCLCVISRSNQEKGISHSTTIQEMPFTDSSKFSVLQWFQVIMPTSTDTPSDFKLTETDLRTLDSLVKVAMQDIGGLFAEDRVGHQPLHNSSKYIRQYVPMQYGNDK